MTTKAAGLRRRVNKKPDGSRVVFEGAGLAPGSRLRIGAYAKEHATTNEDGSITYEKKKGGTVTKSVIAAGTPKPPKRPRLDRTLPGGIERPSNGGGGPRKDIPKRPKKFPGRQVY